jgi:CheY-like chemotaxis protein
MRILVIDGETATQKFFDLLLRPLAHEVVAIPDVGAALEHTDSAFDLLFCAMDLPKLGGIEVMVAFRRHQAQLPIVAMVETGQFTKETVHQAIDAGAFRILTKPLESAEVLEIVTSANELTDLNQSGPDQPFPT